MVELEDGLCQIGPPRIKPDIRQEVTKQHLG
jgi:hypothetical protein